VQLRRTPAAAAGEAGRFFCFRFGLFEILLERVVPEGEYDGDNAQLTMSCDVGEITLPMMSAATSNSRPMSSHTPSPPPDGFAFAVADSGSDGDAEFLQTTRRCRTRR